jgi:hypothetical protein
MKNQYYLKDKKARIYKVGTEKDSIGQRVTVYKPYTPAPIWCYAAQLSESLTFEARAYGNEETRLFVFNAGTAGNLYDLVEYRGVWYEITRVDTQGDYNGDIFIYVHDCPKGKVPKASEIQPYSA